MQSARERLVAAEWTYRARCSGTQHRLDGLSASGGGVCARLPFSFRVDVAQSAAARASTPQLSRLAEPQGLADSPSLASGPRGCDAGVTARVTAPGARPRVARVTRALVAHAGSVIESHVPV